MKKIITDDYEFEHIIAGKAVYVDKTDLLARMASGRDGTQFFIARPRRFGKSLMLSTLQCLFEGRRDLFRGLKIEKTKWDWSKTYPVVTLNMSKIGGESPEDIEAGLYSLADDVAQKFGLKPKAERRSGQFFANVLDALYAKRGPFVVLVDEYDVPLQGFLDDRRAIRRVRKIMHDFYVQLKNNAKAIRFLMITGVTKLTKLTLFSGLNNPIDLSIKYGDYAALLGYTHAELKTYFSKHVAALGRKLHLSPKQAETALLSWYDSYRFSPYSNRRVINPVALGEALKARALAPFWTATGLPTLAFERMEACGRRPDQLEDVEATLDDLDVCDALSIPLVPLLYQSGYLTIKRVRMEKTENGVIPILSLGIPNNEVRHALKSQWWKSLMQMKEGDFTALVHEAERQIAAGDIEGLVCETLYRLYAKLPPNWSPKKEADAKRYFLLFMEMAGAKMQAEEPSARGFADAVLETKKGVWIFEFKYNRSAASAIRQIRERGYAEPYREVPGAKRLVPGAKCLVQSAKCPVLSAKRSTQRPITLVGIKFDANRRNIDMPRIEAL